MLSELPNLENTKQRIGKSSALLIRLQAQILVCSLRGCLGGCCGLAKHGHQGLRPRTGFLLHVRMAFTGQCLVKRIIKSVAATSEFRKRV